MPESIDSLPNSQQNVVPGTPSSYVDASPFRATFTSPSGSDLQSRYTGATLATPGTVGSVGSIDSGTEQVLWGTTINAIDTLQKIRDFLVEFKLDPSDEESYYIQKLKEISVTEKYSLLINCTHISQYAQSNNLYTYLIQYPHEMIPLFDIAVAQLYQDFFNSNINIHIIVRYYNLRETIVMRSLDPKDIDTLISIKGMIIRTSPIIPDLKKAYFKCCKCSKGVYVECNQGRIDEPNVCESCSAKNTMELIHNRCDFSNKQFIKMQEAPELIPKGETPQTVNIYVFDDLIDVAKPGDRVDITGILRAVPNRVNPNQRTVYSIYRLYIDCLHILKIQKGKLNAGTENGDSGRNFADDYNNTDVNEDLVRKYQDMAADPDIYNKLVRSFAPSIWQMDDVKRGLICMLIGGNNNNNIYNNTNQYVSNNNNNNMVNLRGEINILLCGDPGLSKSQLLTYVHKLSPRGIYTSGKGSSAVGLTAYVTKDTDTKEMVLESGALVLSDRGICCIDEFDKMSDSSRNILHEVMEQQTISVAKAGIICTLNARTSILASANPIQSRYNTKLSVVQNIRLPPSLLSRFDLIYLLLDKVNENSDKDLAEHITSLYLGENSRNKNTLIPYDVDTLTGFISYVRRNGNPKISDRASTLLRESYVNMRNSGAVKGKVITATPRQLESLIRISESLAKMKLLPEVTETEVVEAVRLVNVATQKAAVDPRTGMIDMDVINTGITAVEREEAGHAGEDEAMDMNRNVDIGFGDDNDGEQDQ